MRPAGYLALVLTVPLQGCEGPAEAPHTSPESASCGGCHPAQYDRWAASPLATGSGSPVFSALVERVEESWGEVAAETCRGCHSPGHATGGGHFDDDEAGVGCVTCHAAVGNRGERDARLVVDLSQPLAGPFGDTESPAHGSRKGELLRDPALCGTCHEVTGPHLLVEHTLTEYRASPAAAAGRTCVDCHMPRLADAPISTLSDTPRARRDHSFVGLDPPWGAPPDVAAESAERTRALLAEALDLSARATPEGFVVEVENVGAGHHVPTGVSMLRDIRVTVRILDAADKVLLEDPSLIQLGARMLSGDTEVGLLTAADRIVDETLPPGETRRATLPYPPGAASLEAVIEARAFKPNVLAALGLEDLELPLHRVREVRVAR